MPTKQRDPNAKTIIGVLASHDDVDKNNDLARTFESLWASPKRDCLERFHFLFTGGTYRRIVEGIDTETPPRANLAPVKTKRLVKFLTENSTSLPDRKYGGVTLLANFIVQRQCSIVWPFLSSSTMHWLSPENLALMRLCDIWNEKRLMNCGSVETWFEEDEADIDAGRNPQPIPLRVQFGAAGFSPGPVTSPVSRAWLSQWVPSNDFVKGVKRDGGGHRILPPEPKLRKPEFWRRFGDQTIALIAHDEMKKKMVDFAVEYERELAAFDRILATGTTGKLVKEATRKLEKKIRPCHSGPKGGDIEISTEILYGRCDVVIFFVDPLNAHPHIEDIRAVFSACMVEDGVRMLTNEVQAREWMDRVVRPNV